MRVQIKLSVSGRRGAPLIGSGQVELLGRVERLGTIQSAARSMGLSYAKAHRILKGLERGSGREFLTRRRGGNDRGGARLTPYARSFLAEFGLFQEFLHAHASRRFSALFGLHPSGAGRARARGARGDRHPLRPPPGKPPGTGHGGERRGFAALGGR